jgi:hypothetical protein|tara:strand:+ start:129 stop:407 length:279 start_codon:yes stop_codon:yes gene_type:complete
MAIENVQQLLTEQLGKNGSTVVMTSGSGAVTGDYYCAYFPVETVVAQLVAADATGESALQTTIPAGVTIFMNITTLKLTSGVAILYHEGPTT